MIFVLYSGHCHHLEPDYREVAVMMKDSGASFGKLNAPDNYVTQDKYEVYSWGTILLFHDGQKLAYDGPSSAEFIKMWVQEQLDASSPPKKDETHTEDL